MIQVSVIIVNLNTRLLLRDCLQSVIAQHLPDIEVIVVDNGSTDGSAEMVESGFPGVRLIRNSRNEGFARPNNVAMKIATGRYLFLLNSDAVVKPGALAVLTSFLDTHPEAGACGPRLVYPDGRLQRSVKGFPTVWTHACDMFFLDKLFPRSRLFGRGEQAGFDYRKTQAVDHVMAAAFLVRHEVVATTGLFDERFSIYYNDMDWCYRMRKSGWKIYYVHDSVVVHHLGKTIAEVNRNLDHLGELYDNTMLFYRKTYGSGSVIIYRLLLVAGFIPRTVGWGLFRLMDRSERTAHMAAFSWRSLGVGGRFWTQPSESVERNDDGT